MSRQSSVLIEPSHNRGTQKGVRLLGRRHWGYEPRDRVPVWADPTVGKELVMKFWSSPNLGSQFCHKLS